VSSEYLGELDVRCRVFGGAGMEWNERRVTVLVNKGASGVVES